MANSNQFGGKGEGRERQERSASAVDCARFEAGLMDALDGLLDAGAEAEFRAHAAACGPCAASLLAIEQGIEALQSLEEVEPPPLLVHNILAKTAFRSQGQASAQPRLAPGAGAERGWWRGMRAVGWKRSLAQPRFAMSLGMAFFSITLLLNVGGVKGKDLKLLRPATLRTTAALKFYETEAHIVKYYENLRIVYELESRYREIKNSQKPAGDDPGKKNKDTSRLGGEARDIA